MKQTIQPRANGLSVMRIYFILLSFRYSVMVSTLGIISSSFLQVAAKAKEGVEKALILYHPHAGLNSDEGPWQRGKQTNSLYVWMTSLLTA